MKFKTISFERLGDHVGQLTIDRPEAMNALNSEVLAELAEFLDKVPELKLRALVVTGAGEKAFVAGADIKEMKNFGPSEALELSEKGQALFRRLEQLPMLTVAMVNGFALGGGMELALSCDMIFASEKAKFGLPEVSLGLIPGYGGTQRLSRCIGVAKAKMIAMSGDIYSASELYGLGLVAKLCEPDALSEQCLEFCTKVAQRAPLAVLATKKLVALSPDLNLEEGLKSEAEAFSQIFTTEDKTEGISAFIEKRKPNFQGK